MADSTPGKLIVVSGPSGAGKSTLLKKIFATTRLPLVPSVSATTRAPRPGEVDGEDYFFLTPEQFAARRAAGDFLECFEVFGGGHWYGTLRDTVTTSLAAGKWVLLEIDVQGTMAVRGVYPAAVTIFVRPRSFAELETRLRARGTETPEALQRRLDVARNEMAAADRYDYQVENEDLDEAVAQFCEILNRLGAENA